jgi:hypothetical protein
VRQSGLSYDEVLYGITHVPGARASLWLIVGFSIGIGTAAYALQNLSLALPIPVPFIVATAGVGFALFTTAAYRSVHQLGIIRHLIDNVTRFGLYDLSSVYALSLFPAKIVLLNLVYLWVNPALLIFPDMFRDPVFLGYWVLLSLIPALAIYPTFSRVRQRLIAEKEALLKENSLHLAHASERLYGRMGSGQYAGMADFEKAVSALLAFRREIESISTWPWKPETMRWLATAMILPLAIWLVQMVIQRFVIP